MKIFQKNICRIFLGFISIIMIFGLVPFGWSFASAQSIDPDSTSTADENFQRLERVGDKSGFETNLGTFNKDNKKEEIASSAVFLIAIPFIRLIKIVYGFLATILVILIIKAGYVWLTAEGNEEKVTKAKNTLSQAFIGFFLLTASALIVYFVLLILGQVETDIINSGAGDLR